MQTTSRKLTAPWLAVAALAGGTPFLISGAQKTPDRLYKIAYGSFAPVRPNLFIADGNGEHIKPLLGNANVDYNGSFSRDGVWIVFTSERNGSADIYRVHADGSGLERLTDDPAFDDQGVLSPDGRTLAFVSTRGGAAQIWSLDLGTRKQICLTRGSTGDFRPAWSPDGEWIAFSSDRDGIRPAVNFATVAATSVYVMRKDGSDVRRLTPTGVSAGNPSWSPDGSRVVYYQTAVSGIALAIVATSRFALARPPNAPAPSIQLVSTEVQKGATETLANGPDAKWFPRWLSPDDIRYASVRGIERVNGSPGPRGEFGNPNWAADRTKMVFHREAGSEWPPFRAAATLDRGFELIRTGIFPSYSPAGDRLICNGGISGIAHNEILVMNTKGANRRVVFEDPVRSAVAPVWSPRGDRIAFALGQIFPMVPGREHLTSQLALIRLDGSDLQVLTAAGNHVAFPSWSPDGKRLVFRSAGAQGRALQILDLATNRVTDLANGPHNDNFPAWSPKGDRIAFTSDRDGDFEIYSIRPDGTDLTRLTRSRGNDAHLAWSPDGRWIAFASARTGFLDELLLHPDNGQANGEIFVMRSDGSDVRRLTENPWEDATPAWQPFRGRGHRPPGALE